MGMPICMRMGMGDDSLAVFHSRLFFVAAFFLRKKYFLPAHKEESHVEASPI